METSDSEHFESADEEFQSSDAEISNTKKKRELGINTKKKLQAISTSEPRKIDDNKNKEPSPRVSNKINSNIGETVSGNYNKNVSTRGVGLVETSENDNQDSTKSLIPDGKSVSNLQNKVEPNDDNNQDDNMWEDEDFNMQTLTLTDDNISSPRLGVVKKCDNGAPDTPKNVTPDSKNLHNKLEPDEDDNMWENDTWEPIEDDLPPLATQEQISAPNTGWTGWGNWGVSTLLSTASQGVSTITQGLSTVLETGIGVPEPEEMARINKTKQDQYKDVTANSDAHSGFGLGNFVMGVSHLTKLVETTSTKVISGGLDTLETIGKKTMEVLQDGDPGLRKKRAFLRIEQDGPVLSALLREAKDKAEQENKLLEQKHYAKKAKNYEMLFDDHQGLVHLEALEMLSRQCGIKLQNQLESCPSDALTEMQETLDQVKELCELPDEEDDEQANFDEIREKLEAAVLEINIPISYRRLFETWEEEDAWLKNLKLEVCDERELHQQAIECLAQLTAIAVEQFHKTGELLLVKEHRSTVDEADSLVQLTSLLVALIGIVAAKFSDKLNAKNGNLQNNEQINGLITNVFYEAANSSSYIQDAFQLLIPVLQVGAV